MSILRTLDEKPRRADATERARMSSFRDAPTACVHSRLSRRSLIGPESAAARDTRDEWGARRKVATDVARERVNRFRGRPQGPLRVWSRRLQKTRTERETPPGSGAQHEIASAPSAALSR